MRQHLETLRPKLHSLPLAIGNVDWDSSREERRAYIEQRVRKVVGAGSGGAEERVGAGGKVGLEEVLGVEGIVRGMGREI